MLSNYSKSIYSILSNVCLIILILMILSLLQASYPTLSTCSFYLSLQVCGRQSYLSLFELYINPSSLILENEKDWEWPRWGEDLSWMKHCIYRKLISCRKIGNGWDGVKICRGWNTVLYIYKIHVMQNVTKWFFPGTHRTTDGFPHRL